MSDLALDLDTDSDLTMDDNDLQLTSGQEAIRQHLIQRLRTFFKEWFLDRRIGIPYFEHILVKNPDPVIVDSVLKSEVINTQGIEELTSWSLETDNTRKLTNTFTARTIEGDVISFDEELP